MNELFDKGMTKTPKTAKGSPLLGNTIDAIKDPLTFLISLKNKYDDLVTVRIGGKKYFIAQSPAASSHILQENAGNYIKPGAAKMMKQFLGDGLATSNGSLGLRQRRLIQPAFHKSKLVGILQVINEETDLLIQHWKTVSPAQPVNVNDALLKLTLGNISRTMFGSTQKNMSNELAPVITRLMACASSSVTSIVHFPLSVPTPGNLRFRKAIRDFEEIIYKIINQRKNVGDGQADLLDLLLHAYDSESGTRMSEKQLRDEIATIFMTGHETTAQTLSWVLYELACHPNVYERIRNESCGAGVGITSMDTLQRLSYTKAVIEETMRLYPPVWVMARKSVADDCICGFYVPAGTTVLINIYGMNHHQGYWNNPESFVPERFLDADSERHPILFIPFGMGRRLCIGNMFAMTVMQTVLAKLVGQFSFQIADGHTPVVRPNITLRAKDGIVLRINQSISSSEYANYANRG